MSDYNIISYQQMWRKSQLKKNYIDNYKANYNYECGYWTDIIHAISCKKIDKEKALRIKEK